MSKLPLKNAKLDDMYARKDVVNERFCRVDERCSNHEKTLKILNDSQKATDRKITASLIFAIVTLATIVTFFITHP